MLASLPNAQNYPDGDLIVAILLQVIVALSMLGTPMIFKSITGGGLASVGAYLQGAAMAAPVIVFAKATSLYRTGKSTLQGVKKIIRPIIKNRNHR